MLGSLWLNSFSAGGGGAAADYELITTTLVTSAVSSVTFSSLNTAAAAYKHLQIRSTHSVQNNGQAAVIRFNGDSASNYRTHRLGGNGSSVDSADYGSGTRIIMSADIDSSTTQFGASITEILDFASTTKNKTVRTLAGALVSTNQIRLYSGAWFSTSAITSIEISSTLNNFVTGSRFSLYGLK